MLEKEYSRLRRTEDIEVRPSVIHFGGFSLNKPHVYVVNILNVSVIPKRITIIPPTSEFFSIEYDRKGRLSPGLAEEIKIIFEPTEWRYYYDCIRIHSGDENLIVPIHGYPVVNEVSIPKLIDFGKCALGDVEQKVKTHSHVAQKGLSLTLGERRR